MAKLTVTEAQEYEAIPHQTLLDARISNVEVVEREFPDGKTNRLSWQFTITEDGEYQGRDVYTDTPTTFVASPNCTAFTWTTAVTGHQFDDGEEFDTDDLIGMPCRIIVHLKTSKKGRDYNKVDSVLPPASRPESAPF